MSKQRDAKTSQANIIKSATKLFAINGFNATTVDDIAKSANINKAMIFYYYKSKEGLYEYIMTDMLDHLLEKIKQIQTDDPMNALRLFIEIYVNFAYQKPCFSSLLLKELSNSGATLPNLVFTKLQSVLLMLKNILISGNKKNIFIKKEVIVVYFMITGTINLIVSTQKLRNKIKDMDVCQKCPRERLIDEVFDNIMLVIGGNQ